jgi:DNA gyrase subunit A
MENIIDVNILKQHNMDFSSYAVYVLRKRALPDPRDGFKPVHRKIIYTLFNDFHDSGKHQAVKSMAVVGRVIQKYHPHGDQSVSGALKPMVNWFEIYMPLIVSQGGFGSMYGDKEAAARYTEIALSDYAYDCIIGDLKDSKNSVDWQDTYDGKYKEPVCFPATVPNLLINGSFGIAVGLATSIPKHNINDVIDATIHLMHHPNSNIVLIPDNCSGSDIVDTDWANISKTGRGKFKVRGIMKECTYNGKMYNGYPALKVLSMPDMIFFKTVKEELEKLKITNILPQIEDILNTTTIDDNTSKELFEIYIIFKKGTDINYVKNIIYTSTSMQANVSVNFEVIYNDTPVLLGYKEYLQLFIDFRRERKLRTYTNRLQNARTESHKMALYIKALESGEIDNILKMIRKQKGTDDSIYINYLIDKLKVTPVQAKFLLDTDIRKLSMGYLKKYKEELIKHNAIADECYNIIIDPNAIDKKIEFELKEAKRKYGCPRRSRIISLTEATGIPDGIFKVIVTEKGFIKKIGENERVNYLKDDKVKLIVTMNNKDSLLLFSKIGKVFKLPVHKIPFAQRGSNGIDIRILLKKEVGEINTIIPQSILEELKSKNCLLYALTKFGLFKRMPLDDFITSPPSGMIYYKLDDGDEVVDILIMDSDCELLIYSHNKILRINGNEAPLLNRATKGNIAMVSKYPIDGFSVISPDTTDIIAITYSGKINRVSINAAPLSNRAKSGTSIIKLGKNDAIKKILICSSNDVITITTQKDTYSIPVNSLPIGSSISSGTKVVDSSGIIKIEK